VQVLHSLGLIQIVAMTNPDPRTLAFLGATGRMGFALAVAHAKAGHNVVIASRDASRANEAAERAKQQLAGVQGAGAVEGAELTAAVQKADVVFLVYGGYVEQDKVRTAKVQINANE
jgi:NAD(P)-dependent dehydrogenase (short-subunit alcohol dehydrogenase family)